MIDIFFVHTLDMTYDIDALSMGSTSCVSGPQGQRFRTLAGRPHGLLQGQLLLEASDSGKSYPNPCKIHQNTLKYHVNHCKSCKVTLLKSH